MLKVRHYLITVLSLVIFSTLSLAGCSGVRQVGPKFIDDIRPIAPALRTVTFNIQRAELIDRLTRINERPVRLVPVYQSVSSTESYEYRLFDITVGGVYELLGLENSDIVVALNRYLIRNPVQFQAFVQLLAAENEATIEIRRGGEARVHRYSFLPVR